MANRQPRGDLRAFVVPLANTLTASYSATTQSGPRPGPAVPVQATAMALDTSGTLTATLDEITLATLEAGNVGTSTLRWKYTADNAYRSWDPPNAMSAWEKIAHTNIANTYRNPHAAQRSDTGLLLASVTFNTTTVRAWAQSERGKWSSVDIEDTGNTTVSTIVWLPRGRAVCFYTYQVGTTKTQIKMAYSDDGGTTWSAGSSACLASPLAVASADVDRIRACYLNGQILLLVFTSDTTDVIAQYCSTDEGGNFALVETFSTSDKAAPDVTVSNGTIYVATIEVDAGRADSEIVPFVRALSSCAQPLSSAEAVDAGATAGGAEWGQDTGQLVLAECAIVADGDLLWLYGLDAEGTDEGEVITRFSADGGATWSSMYDSSHNGDGTLVHWTGDASIAFRDLTVACERGRVVMLHTYTGDVVNDYGSLCAAYLGGWSTVGLPEDDEYDPGTGVIGWDTVWVAIDKPSDTGSIWTETLTGAATAAIGAQGITLTTGVGETAAYTAAPVIAGASANGFLAEFHVRVTSGTGVLNCRISDGTNSYSVRVSVTPTTVVLRDTTGAIDIGSPATVDGDSGVAIRVAIDKAAGAWSTDVGRVRAWFMDTGPYAEGVPLDRGPPADREWTSIATTSTLVSGASTTPELQFGITGVGVMVARLVAFSPGLYVGPNIATSVNGQTRGRTVPPASSPLHLTSGLRVHGTDGPTVSGDTWIVTTDHEYPVEALNPRLHPSPRRTWRSVGFAETDIILSDVDLGWGSNQPIAVYLEGCNFETATLYRDSTGTDKILDINLSQGLTGMAFSRARAEIHPVSGGNAAPFHFHEGSLVGSRIDFGGTDIRKIGSSRAGAWQATGNEASYPSARIVLEDYDSGDASSGTMSIRMHRGLFIVEGMATTNTIMLRIPTQDVSDDENYFTIGTMIIGRLRTVRQWGRGRSLTWTPSYELTTTRGGARRGRRLGPTRRAMEFSWDEGVPTAGLHTPGTAPHHVTLGYTGAPAIASEADTPRTLGGIIDETDGATLPVVLAIGIDQFTAATTATTPHVILNPDAMLHGRIMTETIRIDSVNGDELSEPGEIFRIGTVRVEEEV